jgi:hypothetical protein
MVMRDVRNRKMNRTHSAIFDAGVAAYQVNNLPLAYKEFLAAAKAVLNVR